MSCQGMRIRGKARRYLGEIEQGKLVSIRLEEENRTSRGRKPRGGN